MPKIRLQLSNASEIFNGLVDCEQVPMLGEVLDVTGNDVLASLDDKGRAAYLVTSIHQQWEQNRLMPVVFATAFEGPLTEELWDDLMRGQTELKWPRRS